MLASSFVLAILLVFFMPSSATAIQHGPSHALAVSRSKYVRAHSLGKDYQFDPRDGWQNATITNMAYTDHPGNHVKGSRQTRGIHSEHRQPPSIRSSGVTDTVKSAVSAVFKGLKAIGKTEPVTITWYTGHDLLNPSCWSQTGWHPTDKSFACALTEEGWTDRPKCFAFLELCHGPHKCVFVRVVDTCAGCAAGSKHVDLTRAAFGELADFSEGVLTVQLRAATEPTAWNVDLWGPR